MDFLSLPELHLSFGIFMLMVLNLFVVFACDFGIV